MQPAPSSRQVSLSTILIMLGLMVLGAAFAMAATQPRRAVAPPDQVLISPTVPLPATTTSLAPTAEPPAPLQALGPEATPSPTVVALTPSPSATMPTVKPAPPSPTPTVVPATPTPTPKMPPPTHIQIPSVGIDAPVVEVGYDVVTIDGQQVIQWRVADYAAGHNNTSANPGEGGNIVISGHDDWKGEVFRNLEHVKIGDLVILTNASGQRFTYRVEEIHYRKEVGVPLQERLATGMFLAPMPEERVTLVTCWPYGIDDHRLIVVAKPVRQ